MNNQPISPIDAILDENNNDNIFLYNEAGKLVEFSQVALIPLNGQMYTILKFAQPMEGVGEDEGIVFAIKENNEDSQMYLSLISDEKIIDDVFNIYDDLVNAQNDN